MRAHGLASGKSLGLNARHVQPWLSTTRCLRSRLYVLKPPSEARPSTSTTSNPVTGKASPELPTNFAEMCQSVDNATLPGNKKFMEASICRLYYFSESQVHQFKHLVASMMNARSALTALAAANILLTLAQALGYGGHEHHEAVGTAATAVSDMDLGNIRGLTIGDVAYWADSLMVAGLISYAIGPFERVQKSRSNQMAYTFQGLNRLALIFQQLSIGSIAVSTVTGLEAAAKYPPLVLGTSVVFFGVAVVRSAAMWWTLSRHTTNNEEVSRTLSAMRDPDAAGGMSLLDRWATFLAFGYLLQYEQKSPQAPQSMTSQPAMATQPSSFEAEGSYIDTTLVPLAERAQEASPASPATPLYEFSLLEERLLRGLTEAASTAGLALGLQAFVTLMLTIADFGVDDLPGMVGNGINATNKAIMAAILFNACSAYDRALHTAGSNDVDHLMDGLGSKGLTGLFESLAVLSWAVTIATVVGLALPLMEENMLAKFVGDGLSHRTAEALIELLEYAQAIMRGM